MALTLTEVPTINQIVQEFPLGSMKARVQDVLFDNSYPTGGEVVTAASLGWSALFGAIVMLDATNAAGTLTMPVMVKPNAAKTQVTLQLAGYDGASAGKASLEEKANAFDASLFTARIMWLGN